MPIRIIKTLLPKITKQVLYAYFLKMLKVKIVIKPAVYSTLQVLNMTFL